MAKSKEKIALELQNATRAADEDQDGLARVCARRAVGWSIEIWLNKKGVSLNSPSAFDHIKHLKEQPDTPVKIATILQHLTTKASHAEDSDEHIFPVALKTFLIEAHWLSEQMLGEKIEF